MHKVAILISTGVSTFELGCAVELFARPRPEYSNWYNTDVVTFEQSPVEAVGGLSVSAKCVRSLKIYQTLLIPSWSTATSEIKPALKKELLKFAARGGRVLSFCSGSFLLAELGLLDGLTATTHWHYAQQFQQRFPHIEFVENVLYLYNGQIGCSAGSAAAIDLGIEVIRQDFGYKIANAISRRMVVSAHRNGGQAQYIETNIVKKHDHFSSTLDWAIKNLNQKLDVDMLAKRANSSRRSFDRHFRESLGLSPKQWINKQRLALAQSLLESGKRTIDQTAIDAGFENSMNMRHYFRKYLGISPSQYKLQYFSNR